MAGIDILLSSPGYELAKLIAAKVASVSVDAPNDADLPLVRAETERQENEMRRLEAQAKVAQELAIAARIESAVEVEIEEYFEYAGDGRLGLNTDAGSVSLSASASGKTHHSKNRALHGAS